MNDILRTIIDHKRTALEKARREISTAELESSPAFGRPTRSLRESLLRPGSTGIIAEFKRRSPSKGMINGNAEVRAVTCAYAAGGAAGLSVLTDTRFFGGSEKDLRIAREQDLPLLRKDFIIDEYQILEARVWGADVILLIAACLSPGEVDRLARFAHGIGLEVLLEIHDPSELDHISPACDLVGVNNRNLRDFTVDVGQSVLLSSQIPGDFVKISESGISNPETITMLREHGFRGFLIGEHFMKEQDPAIAFASFVQQVKPGIPTGEQRH